MRPAPTAVEMMRLFEAAYDVEQPKAGWFDGLLRAAGATLDQGLGVGGVLYEISADNGLHVDTMKGLNMPDGWLEVGRRGYSDLRYIPLVVNMFRTSLCATLSDLATERRTAGPIRTIRREQYDPHGVTDQITINGYDSSGKGCCLFLFSAGPLTLSEAQRDLFSRLATHLTTAYRLQRQLAGSKSGTAVGVEAVLTPSGQIDHAEDAAKSVETLKDLSLAVRRRERIRDTSSDSEDGTGVVRGLRGLVTARWTLVDHYETGGKRYVLARENAPKPPGPALLSERERQVVALAALGRSNKLIAYELGLAHSTVRVLMARACVKLGTPTRSQLVARGKADLSR